jgi:hypothetical protein
VNDKYIQRYHEKSPGVTGTLAKKKNNYDRPEGLFIHEAPCHQVAVGSGDPQQVQSGFQAVGAKLYGLRAGWE